MEPKLDVVVTVQADSTLCPGWWAVVSAALLSGSKLVQAVVGQLIVYTPEAIRRVGLYDERFVGICHHEGDFFLRASLALREAACIHDTVHSRVADLCVFCKRGAVQLTSEWWAARKQRKCTGSRCGAQ